MDVGYVERIILKEGANVTLTGSAELRLRDSISISPSLDDNRLIINTKDIPKLNIYGHRVEIKNNDGEELKVKKKYASVLEVAPAKDTLVKEGRLPFEIPLNDSRIETIQVPFSFSPNLLPLSVLPPTSLITRQLTVICIGCRCTESTAFSSCNMLMTLKPLI